MRAPGYAFDDDAKAYFEGRLHVSGAKEIAAYRRDLLVATYGEGHPYARTGMTEDSLAHLHHDLVVGWARDHIVPANTVLVVAGAFDADVVTKHVAYDAAHVSSGSRTVPVKSAHPARSGPHYVRGAQAQPSSTIALDVQVLGEDGLDRTYAKWLVLVDVVERRLDHATALYGFDAGYTPRRAGSLLRISGGADASHAADAATELVAILADLRANPESVRAAFVLSRAKVLDRLLASSTSVAGVADQLALEAQFDVAADFHGQLATDVAQLTLADFAPFVADQLAPDRLVIGAFGNAAAVDAALAAARGK